jgi:MOSC domain-containing protein YiiM
MIESGRVAAVHVGKAERLENAGRGGRGLMTAYRKTPVAGPVAVGVLGLDGDVQHNRRYHGGPDKAVYAYPLSGYAGWRSDFPDIAARFVAGAMGENLVVTGQDEAGICIGDMIRCGTATLQVAQLREPCSTFAAVLGTTRVVRAMVRTGRCGWYCRVVEPGIVAPGDAHDIIDRPNPTWTVARFAAFVAEKTVAPEILLELGTLPGLAPAWQQTALERLAARRSG